VRQAAKASWISFIFALGCLALLEHLKRSLLENIIGITLLFLPLLGFVLGLIALFGIRKHGIKGILLPAVIGLVLNGLFMGWIQVPAIMAGLRRAHQFQERKRRLAATQSTAPAVAQDTSIDSAALRTALVGKWVLDPEATADAFARAEFRERRQVIRLPAKPGQPPAYRTNIVKKPFNAQEYERLKADGLRGFHSITNAELPSLGFAADGTGESNELNATADAARARGFQWRLDGHTVTMIHSFYGRTNQFQFTNQTQLTIPFQPHLDRGLFVVLKREGANSK
jgi:hypothetical protein